MNVQRVGGPSFQRIILDTNEPIPAGILFNATEKLKKDKNVTINPFDFLNGQLLPKVIESDYDTFELKNRFNELVKSQETNPHDIHLDVFLHDEGEIPLYVEGWYQKATVGNQVFKQRQYAYEGSAIKFLEDACKYADKLNGKVEETISPVAKESKIAQVSKQSGILKFIKRLFK